MKCLQRFGFFALAWAAVGLLPALAQTDAGTPSEEWQVPYDQGLKLIEEGKYREAIESINKAIEAIPELPLAYVAKADALKEMGDFGNAAAAYSQAINIDASSAAAYNGRGECFLETGQADLALNDFTNALNFDRGNAAALSNIGHIYVNYSRDPQQGLDRLEEALALNPQDARAHRDSAYAHALLREFDKGVVSMQKAIEIDPDDYENYATLANIYLFQNKYSEAADALGQAITAYKPVKRADSPAFISGYLGRADARLKMAEGEKDAAARKAALEGVIADANSVLEVFADRFPESGSALYRRGRAQRLLEQYGEGVDTLTEAIQLVPAGQAADYLSDAHLFRGICWFHIESYDLARRDFERASAIGNGFQDPRVFLWIGYTYHKQGDYRQAIDGYNQAIAKYPDFALAHVNKGRAYMDLREYNKAIESFNNAIGSEPDVGEHYYDVGVACLKLEDFEKANSYLTLALKKPNPQPKMFRAIAKALRGLNRPELAEEYERQAEAPAAAVNGG